MGRSRTKNRCHADSDGDCYWEYCPQLRDGEPTRSGRSCPLPPGPYSLNGIREMMEAELNGDNEEGDENEAVDEDTDVQADKVK